MPVPCIIIKQKTRFCGFFVLYWLRGKATAESPALSAKVPTPVADEVSKNAFA